MSSRDSSSALSRTSIAAIFSSSLAVLLVPGMGTTSWPLASTQARASCEGVQPFSVAISRNLAGQGQVPRQVLPLEAGIGPPPVGRREFVHAAESAGQEPATKWAVRHESDAKFAEGGRSSTSGSRLQSEYSTCRTVWGTRSGRHRPLRWRLGKSSARHRIQPRMSPATSAGPRRTGRGCEPTYPMTAANACRHYRRAS
jgi:hypothetical protein